MDHGRNAYLEEHYLGPEYMEDDPEDEEGVDAEEADELEWALESLQEDLHMMLRQLELEVGCYERERPGHRRMEAVQRILLEFGR